MQISGARCLLPLAGRLIQKSLYHYLAVPSRSKIFLIFSPNYYVPSLLISMRSPKVRPEFFFATILCLKAVPKIHLLRCLSSYHVSNFATTLWPPSSRLHLKDTTFFRLLRSRAFFATLSQTSHLIPHTMCRDHFTLYECNHMRFIELEPCPYFSTTKNKCLKAPYEMINHLPDYKCR